MKHYLSLGAGVQSSTLAMMFANGEPGLPRLDGAIFADTQREPAAVYAWFETLKKLIAAAPYPFPVHVVTAGDLGAQTLRLRTSKKTGNKYIRALVPAFFQTKKGRGILGRKCTAEFKVRALIAMQKRLTKVPRKNTEILCTMYIGISWDEYHRMKPSKEPWCKNEWPLVDRMMDRSDCKKYMADHGYPEPPRSACYFCPFHSDTEWRRLRDHEPQEFARAVEFDKELRRRAAQCTGTAKLSGDVFLHGSLKPLDEVVFTESKEVDKFGNDCTGLCGV